MCRNFTLKEEVKFPDENITDKDEWGEWEQSE